MKKNIITSLIALLVGLWAVAQDKKVAVFDPSGNVGRNIKEIVREEISFAIVGTSGYTVLERQMIDKVLEENKFQLSGLVDDAQVGKVGRLMGANLALVTSITLTDDGSYYISCKLIDVATARIERQRTATTASSTSAILSGVHKIIDELLGNKNATEIPAQPSQSVVKTAPPATPQQAKAETKRQTKPVTPRKIKHAASVQPSPVVGNVRGWYQPIAFGVDFGAMILPGKYDSFEDKWVIPKYVFGNLGVRYTKNISPNFGVDIFKVNFGYKSHENAWEAYGYEWEEIIYGQLLSGLRFATNRFGGSRNTYFYTSLRAGVSVIKVDYGSSWSEINNNYTISYPNPYFGYLRIAFATELDFGIHFKCFFLGATVNQNFFNPSEHIIISDGFGDVYKMLQKPVAGLRFGWDFGKQKPY